MEIPRKLEDKFHFLPSINFWFKKMISLLLNYCIKKNISLLKSKVIIVGMYSQFSFNELTLNIYKTADLYRHNLNSG